jgi:universal stress protein A
MSRFQTIVVAIDFSDAAADALEAARALATDPAAHVHLLHVLPDPAPPLWTDGIPPLDLPAIAQAWTEGATTQLAALATAHGLDAARVTTAVAIGTPAHEIARYATARRADAIVLGSHGHGVVRRFLIGSVADRVVRQAPCAVMVVPHHTLREGSEASAAAPETASR